MHHQEQPILVELRLLLFGHGAGKLRLGQDIVLIRHPHCPPAVSCCILRSGQEASDMPTQQAEHCSIAPIQTCSRPFSASVK